MSYTYMQKVIPNSHSFDSTVQAEVSTKKEAEQCPPKLMWDMMAKFLVRCTVTISATVDRQ